MADCGACGKKVAKSAKALVVISADCGITCLALG